MINKSKEILYSSLYKEANVFCQGKVEYYRWLLQMDSNCKALQQYVNEWKTILPLTTIASEVEQLLASWNHSEPPTVIIAQLDKIKEKVAALEEIVKRLWNSYKRMKVLADRKGQAAATNNYISFVGELDKLKIEELDAAVKVLAPKILNEINAVINDYNDEKRTQSENKARANALKERMQPFLGYVDKHGNAEMCRTVLAIVEEILNNPSADPKVDKSRLDDAEKMLEDVDKAFKDEEKQFKKMRNARPNIWDEGRDSLMDLLKLNPRKTLFTVEEFKRRCKQLEAEKKADIERVKAKYSDRVVRRYEALFNDIAKSYHKKEKLLNIEKLIDRRYYKVLMIIGIVVCSLLITTLLIVYFGEVGFGEAILICMKMLGLIALMIVGFVILCFIWVWLSDNVFN